jgi:hypothetical protein
LTELARCSTICYVYFRLVPPWIFFTMGCMLLTVVPFDSESFLSYTYPSVHPHFNSRPSSRFLCTLVSTGRVQYLDMFLLSSAL